MRIQVQYGLRAIAAAGVLALVAAGCGGTNQDSAGTAGSGGGGGDQLSGSVTADGSSTVGPLTTVAAELFAEVQPKVNVTVGTSGTGGGFEKFCAGETDISNASRPIKDEEKSACAAKGITYTELQVAVDALTVVVNKENDWAGCLTTDQLKKVWEPGSKIRSWKDIDPRFPAEEIKLYGPGTDSGTFDYFTDEINGEEGASRKDYSASENDNDIVNGVAGAKGGLGYFGFTYFEENTDKLNAAEIDSGSGCVAPNATSAQDGSYTPLARPLFIYVANKSAARPEVKAFLQYYVDNDAKIAEEAKYIPLSAQQQAKLKSDFAGLQGQAG